MRPFPEVYDINGDPIGGRWFAPSVYDSMRYMFALNIVIIFWLGIWDKLYPAIPGLLRNHGMYVGVHVTRVRSFSIACPFPL